MLTDDTPIISIRGEKVGLGPLDHSFVRRQTGWINDFPLTRTISTDPLPRTEESHESWYRSITSSGRRVSFALYDMADLAPVGMVGLFDLDYRNSCCELGVTISDATRRGRGLGTEAVRLITDYAIHGLEMHNVQLATLEFNVAGIQAYRRAGFTEYGRRRQAWLHNGRRWDVIYMDVVASEWKSPVVATMMRPDPPT
jgi:RimJ/RimL family protein N-acetyltransferase